MSKALQNQLSKSLREQGDMARDMAMAELKDLKKDLQELEKTLTAKKAPDQGLLMDISHGPNARCPRHNRSIVSRAVAARGEKIGRAHV